jgi:hypothetical protein
MDSGQPLRGFRNDGEGFFNGLLDDDRTSDGPITPVVARNLT